MKKDIIDKLFDNLKEDFKLCLINGLEECEERFIFINAYIEFICKLKSNNIKINYSNIEDFFINDIHKEALDYLGK